MRFQLNRVRARSAHRQLDTGSGLSASSVVQPAGERRWTRRIAAAFFGYDFFLSYAWRDGGTYAAELARHLRQRGFKCFLDRQDYRAGDDWRLVGQMALRKTSRLLLVGTPGALKSGPVEAEMASYSKTGKRIQPIDIGGCLARARRCRRPNLVQRYVPESKLRIAENRTQLQVGPSQFVIDELIKSFDLDRQDTKRLRVIRIVASSLAILLVTAIAAAGIAEWQRRRAANALREITATSIATRADACLPQDSDAAVAMAVAAWQMHVAPETRRSLFEALRRRPKLLATHRFLLPEARRIMAAPGGAALLVAGEGWEICDIGPDPASRPKPRFAPKPDQTHAAAWSSNDQFVAVASSDLAVFDAKTGVKLRTLQGLQGSLARSLAWQPAGDLIAVAYGTTLLVVSASSGATLNIEPMPAQPAGSVLATSAYEEVAWDHSGRRLAAVTGQLVQIFEMPGFHLTKSVSRVNTKQATGRSNDSVFDAELAWAPLQLAWNPDSQQLATTQRAGGGVVVWDVARQAETQRYVGPTADAKRCAWHRGGGFFAAIDSERLFLWGTEARGETLATGTFRDLTWLHANDWLATLDEDGALRLWSPFSSPIFEDLDPNHGDASIDRLAWSPSGEQLAFAALTGVDKTSTRELFRLNLHGSGPRLFEHTNAEGFGEDLRWSRDGRTIEALGPRGMVPWRPDELLLSSSGNASQTPLRSARFAPSGDTAAILTNATSLPANSGLPDAALAFIDVRSGARLALCQQAHCLDVVWHPHGSAVAMSFRNELHIVSISDEKRVTTTKILSDSKAQPVLTVIAWSPDGVRVAAAGNDFRVRVWQVANGCLLASFVAHPDDISTLLWLDNETIATGSQHDDPYLRVWNAGNGAPRYALQAHPAGTGALAWHSAGRWLASGGHDQHVYLWRLDEGFWVKHGRVTVSRNLKLDEWRRLVGENLPYPHAFRDLPWPSASDETQ